MANDNYGFTVSPVNPGADTGTTNPFAQPTLNARRMQNPEEFEERIPLKQPGDVQPDMDIPKAAVQDTNTGVEARELTQAEAKKNDIALAICMIKNGLALLERTVL
jgi:hypothetical protein